MAATVMERVKDIVADNLGVDREKITPETSFVNDLGADSLDTVELSWNWKKSSTSTFRMMPPKKFKPLVRPFSSLKTA